MNDAVVNFTMTCINTRNSFPKRQKRRRPRNARRRRCWHGRMKCSSSIMKKFRQRVIKDRSWVRQSQHQIRHQPRPVQFSWVALTTSLDRSRDLVFWVDYLIYCGDRPQRSRPDSSPLFSPELKRLSIHSWQFDPTPPKTKTIHPTRSKGPTEATKVIYQRSAEKWVLGASLMVIYRDLW